MASKDFKPQASTEMNAQEVEGDEQDTHHILESALVDFGFRRPGATPKK